jgi:anti-sigma regulatory factor (Ser/Thr protein kinase)
MSKRVPTVLRVLLRCDGSAPSLARRAVGDLDSIKPVRDDALLVTSELVSNAVLHAGCDPTDHIEVVAEIVPRAVRITVVDVGRSGRAPRVGYATHLDSGGMGLRLVEKLARKWGIDRNDVLRVWAELAL